MNSILPSLVLLCRYPMAGKGKSRMIAGGVTIIQAVHFQRYVLSTLIRRLGRDSRWHLILAVTPDNTAMLSRFSSYDATMSRILPQGTGSLGDRMMRFICHLSMGPIIFIGSDLPYIMPCDIAKAFSKLGSHDAVFGPAMDGGYWLAGFRRGVRAVPRNLFHNVRWSSEYTLVDTLYPLSDRCAFLDMRRDIDTAEDYEWWRRLSYA